MPMNYDVTDLKDAYSAQILILRYTELDENGEPTGGVTTEQLNVQAIVGSPEGRAVGSPGDIRFRIDVPQIWQKITGVRTITGWQLVGGGGGGATPCDSVPQPIQAGSAGAAGIDVEYSRCDHAHPVPVAAAVTISGNANTAGVSTSLVRADHTHQLTLGAAVAGDVPLFTAGNWVATPSSGLGPSPGGVPDQLDVGQAGAAGVSLLYAREDHVHAVPAGTPVTVGQANAAGVATTFARSDHVHRTLVEIENTSVFVGARPTLNFTGAGRPLTIVDVPGDDIELQFNGINVQDDGVAVGQRQILNFTGAGVTATDDAGNTRINIDIPGAGAAETWAQTLVAGNVSGGTDPVISTTDTLRGVDSAAAGTNGGVLNIRAGNYTGGGAGNDVGGAFNILGGSTNATGAGSNQPTSTVAAGDHSGAIDADAGPLVVRGGDRANGTAGALGGALTARGGDITSGTGTGGVLVARGGNAVAGLAGTALFAGGSISTGNSTAATATLQGGDQFGGGAGGFVLVRGGDAPSAGATQNSSGSNVNIRAGSYRLGIGGPAVSPGSVFVRSGQPDGTSTGGITGDVRITTNANAAVGDMASTSGTLTQTGNIDIDTVGPGATANLSGNITLQTGTTNGTGGTGPGDITLLGGTLNNTGQSNAQGGQIFITGGNSIGATTSPGGHVTITAGSQTNTGAQANSPGGSVIIAAGLGAKNNAASGGGAVTATAGNATGAAGPGGAVSITAGNATNAAATGAGGSVGITAGSVTVGGTGAGGSVNVTAGGAAGSGAAGSITCQAGLANTGLDGDVNHFTHTEGAVRLRTQTGALGSENECKTLVLVNFVAAGGGPTTVTTLDTLTVDGRNTKIIVEITAVDDAVVADQSSTIIIQSAMRSGGAVALFAAQLGTPSKVTLGGAGTFAQDVSFTLINSGDNINLIANNADPADRTGNLAIRWWRQEGGFTSV